MPVHVKTAEVLSDSRLCDDVCRAFDMDLPRRYIQNRYGISRRQVDHIKRIYYLNDDKPRIFYEMEKEE